MAIVNKTDPKGVDKVIDAIQSYIYPHLLGAGWTDYECYPRANKNIKGTSIIPEVSQDVKNYIEVLFDDKKNATSFFLVSDQVNFNNEERLIVQEVSLIFQVNLPKLFPSITDHRADEEMHAQILQILTGNEDLFVDVGGYVTTPGRVYDQLRLGDYARGNTPLDDMSEFHVVRFDFTVTYDADDCDIQITPLSDPVVVTINNQPFEVYSAGTSQNITVKDTDGNQVGSKTATNEWTVPASNPPAINVANTIKTGITTSFYANDDGATQRGRLTDFTTLDFTNPFGNTNRFTDDLGGQTYASDVVIDWAFYNQITGNVHGWKRTMQPKVNQADHMAGVPYTFAGYSDWTIPNINELASLAFIGSTSRDYLNYAPFNLVQGSNPTDYLALWSSSRLVANSAYLLGSLPIAITNWFTQRKAILFRIYSLTDLGL